MFHPAQSSYQYVIFNASEAEEHKWITNFKQIQRIIVLIHANGASSNVANKINVLDDHNFKLKTQITRQRHEDSDTELLKIECFVCWRLLICATTFVSAVRQMNIVMPDVQVALHRSGTADKHFYIWPLSEPKYRNELWLLPVAG